jgi:hypothetical protein
MEELLEKYKQYKRDMDSLSKKMEKTKQKIKLKLNEYPEKKYENETDVVYVKSMKRTSVSKKDVPEDFWEQYSVITQYDTLYVKEKN